MKDPDYFFCRIPMNPLYKHRIFCFTENAVVFLWKDNDLPLAACPNNPGHAVDAGGTFVDKKLEPLEAVYRHRIRCVTENLDADRWEPNATPLASCPNDPAHIVDPASSRIIDFRAQAGSTHVLKETADAPTGGYFKAESLIFAAGPNGTVSISKSWPIPISIHSLRFGVQAGMLGDSFSASFGDGISVGVLTADVAIGDVAVSVSPSVLRAAAPGYFLILNAAGVPTDLGRIVSRDSVASTLTLETPSPAAFSAAAPTSVEINARLLESIEFGVEGLFALGDDRSNVISVPANTPMRCVYANSTAAAKRLVAYVHYAY